MNIYLLEQDYVNGYDTYDSMVVVAENEMKARQIHPSSFVTHINNNKWMGTYSGGSSIGEEYENETDDWVMFRDIERIKVTLVGKALSDKEEVISASFNAG